MIVVWPKRDWVALRKGIPGASDSGPLGRDRAQLPHPVGHDLGAARADPVLQRVDKRRGVLSIVAVTPDGRLVTRQFRTSVSSETVISVLRFFRRRIGTPLLVVWDRLVAHRYRATTAYFAAQLSQRPAPACPARVRPPQTSHQMIVRCLRHADLSVTSSREDH
ncbi:hypothetical protein HPT29_025935 (plasmid) [Microvirga terrae]|uniref:Tc1-like transposase DDE domain-containing protein n=1 Tax=Microvirga terrae TaxID=2740529 RepID=A0ABY5S001_9HYPH|nr:hypothetical protein [Microvirga terrae]UVF22583.1 hypothetical protein HPT29_025935 [Microvirga terrae]